MEIRPSFPLVRRIAAEPLLAGAVAVGAVLRLDQIREQVLLDDEWHALHAAVRFGYAQLLTQFGWTDRCIPFSLFFKLLMDTIGLSELAVRAPTLLAGLAALLALPLMLRQHVGREAADAFAWLLAVSPLHAFLSRFARPYAISLLLTTAGTLAFLSWWRGGRRGKRVYAACAVLAPYFHLTALPLVLAPFGLGLVELALGRLRSRPAARGVGEMLSLALVVALGLALVLGAPLALDHDALSYKTGHGQPDLATLSGALTLMAGSASAHVWAVLAALAALGVRPLLRRCPRLALLLGLQATLALAVVLASRPLLIDKPIVLARYCLVGLLVLLLLLACGVADLEARLRMRARLPRGTGTVLVAGILLAVGPWPAVLARPNNFANHGIYQLSYGGALPGWHCPPQAPAFYRQLADRPPGSLRILEAPWYFGWSNSLVCSQRIHRQHVAIGFTSGPDRRMSRGDLPRPGELPVLAPGLAFRLRNFVHVADRAALHRRGIRYVVFHKDLARETWHGGWEEPAEYRVDVGRWIAQYAWLYGPPSYADEDLVVFDVLLQPQGRHTRRSPKGPRVAETSTPG